MELYEPDVHDIALPASDLGFLVPTGPIKGDLPLTSEMESEAALSEFIRQKALVNVNVLSDILVLKAMDPTASSKLIGDALEANYKLSGLAVKNAAKEAPMAVTISINGIKTIDEAPVITIEHGEEPAPAPTLITSTPTPDGS
jgi:hypothetical protein